MQSCWYAWGENKTLFQHYYPTQKVNSSANSFEQAVAADSAFPFGQWRDDAPEQLIHLQREHRLPPAAADQHISLSNNITGNGKHLLCHLIPPPPRDMLTPNPCPIWL